MSQEATEQAQDPGEPVGTLDTLKLYSEIWTGIRETDSISFKLLGLVPLVSVSGSGLLGSLLRKNELGVLSIVLLSLLGAVVTFGLYRWGLRNIQTCKRLLDRAKWLEETSFKMRNLAGREPAPSLFGLRIGKEKAETIIYVASVVAWLVPIIAALAP